jgi:hypothetical protein
MPSATAKSRAKIAPAADTRARSAAKQPGQWIGESRVDWRTGRDQDALFIEIDSGQQLPQEHFEVVSEGPGDVALEQHRENETGNAQRHDDRRRSTRDQSQPKRIGDHSLGTM